MPEALAVLFVFALSLSVYIAARVQTASPTNPVAEIQRLRGRRAWLENRLQLAGRENWDETMRAHLSDEMETVDAELAKLTFEHPNAA